MHATSTIIAHVVLLLAFAAPAADAADGSVLLILDASGSMWGRMEERAKIEIAREATRELIEGLPPATRIGLQAYGHRSKGACDDIEVLAAPGSASRADLLRRIAAIQPKGMTPITAALDRAGELLATEEAQAEIVLISDGKETCGGDPCAAARTLRDRGLPLRVHVVGFDVGAEEREQLACIADAGGGRYFGAGNTAELRQALAQVREEVQPGPRVVRVERPPIGSIQFRNLQGGSAQVFDMHSSERRINYCNGCGTNTQLLAGSYRLKFANFEVEAFEVGAGEPTVFDLHTVAGIIEIRNLQTGGVDLIAHDDDRKVGHFCIGCASVTQVRAGRYRLKFTNFESAPIEVSAGATAVYDLDQVAGILEFPNHREGQVEIVPVAGGKPIARFCKGCGSNTQVPAGRYRIVFPNYALDEVEVAAGQTVVIE
jgi:hypothetical protein